MDEDLENPNHRGRPTTPCEIPRLERQYQNMGPDRDQLSVCVASAMLSFHLLSHKIRLLISQALFIYMLHLPIAKSVSDNFAIAIIYVATWSCLPLLETRDRRGVYEAINQAIPLVIYLFLVRAIHSEDSCLGGSPLPRPFIWMASSGTIRVLFPLFVVLINSSHKFQSIVIWTWLEILRVFNVVTTTSQLLLLETFFDFMDIDFVWYLGYDLILSGLGKITWGYNEVSWFHWRVYLLQVVLLVVWKAKGNHGIYRGMPPRRQRTEIPNRPTTYGYHTLAPGSIRLLLLHARHPDSHIRCSLIETPLATAPNFEAVSYTWGDGGTRRDGRYKILVNGKTVNVTANAFNLLRDRSSYLFPRLLWVDSICINQDDSIEKTQQVRLMGRIYSSASLVTVWMRSTEGERSALERYTDSMRAVVALNLVKKVRNLELVYSDRFRLYKTLMGVRNSSIPFQKWEWEKLSILLDNTWFERIWVVQEVVLGPHVRVLYDGVEMDWQTLVDGLSVLMSRAPPVVDCMGDIYARKTSRSTRSANILAIQRWRKSRELGEEISFTEAIMNTRRFHATDARDKVFGIEGFTAQVTQPGHLPDYSKRLFDVYHMAALRIADNGGISSVLAAAGVGYFDDTTAGLEGLPSWVPDFSQALPCANLSFSRAGLEYEAGGKPGSVISAAIGKTVEVTVKILDKICDLAPPYRIVTSASGRYHLSQLRVVLSALEASTSMVSISLIRGSPYGDTQELDDIVARLLIGDRTHKERPAPPSIESDYCAWIEVLRTTVRMVEQDQHDLMAGVEPLENVLEYDLLVSQAWKGRRVCITDQGYIGLTPPQARVMDVIALVEGAQTPFVFRRYGRDCYYKLVGECYVHGLMDGEEIVDAAWMDIEIV